ncbi:MAG: ribosome hibernation-promoting factor, HPF/YfiA family [Gemmatimonadota bacterium]
MEIIITGRRFDVPEDLARHVHGQFGRLDRFAGHVSRAQVILTEEKNRCEAEAHLSIDRRGGVHSRAEAPDFRTAVDRLVEKLAVQLKKKSSRPRNRRVAAARSSATGDGPETDA